MLVLLTCAISAARADDEQSVDGSPAAASPTSPTEIEHASDVAEPEDEENLSRSIRFGHERAVDQAFAEARQLRDKGEWNELATMLHGILVDSPDVFVRGKHEVYHHAAAEANRLLRESGPQLREVFRRRVAVETRARLDEVIAKQDRESLRRFARVFRQTIAGEQAWELLGQDAFQQGDWFVAAQACEELILRAPEPEALLRRRPELAVRYLRLLADLPEHRQRFWERFGDVLAELRLPDGTRLERPARDAVTAVHESSIVLPLSVVPRWSHSFEVGAAARELVQRGLEDLAEHGLYPPPTWNGCYADGTWIVSQPLGLSAIDAATGEQKWFRPHEWNSAQLYALSQPPEDPLQAHLAQFELLMRMHGEATFNELVTDGQRLFEIVPEHAAGLFEIFGNLQRHTFPTQTLVCLQAGTGETAWTMQGGAVAPVFFASPPALDGMRLYALAESSERDQLLLLAIDPTSGQLERVIDLSRLATEIEDDFGRAGRAGRIVPQGDLLICLTGAGGVVAVDRFSLEFRWAYRFGRSDLPVREHPVHQSRTGALGVHNWQGWRSSQCISATLVDADSEEHAEVTLVVCPESDRLHALNPRTGELIWKQHLPQALSLIGVVGDEVFVQEERDIRALALQTGETLAQLRMPVPGGRGLLVGERYVVPAATGELLEFDLSARTMARPWGHALPTTQQFAPPSVLLQWDDQIVALSHQGLDWLEGSANTMGGQLGPEATMEDRIAQVRRLRQAMQHARAVMLLDEMLATPVENATASQLALLRVETVLEWGMALGTASVLGELRQQMEADPTTSQTWDRLVVEQALAAGHWESALVASVRLWSSPLDESWVVPPSRMPITRLDHWLQGRWATAWEAMTAAERKVVEDQGLVLLQSLLDDAAVDRQVLLSRLDQSPWGQRLRAEPGRHWTDIASYVEAELQLLTQAALTDGSLREATELRLLEHYQDRRDAERWYHRLRQHQPMAQADGHPAPDPALHKWVEQYGPLADDSIFPGWPDRKP
ncbi:MAG: PQQ-binding-like beta-propeller repeat protein, partial [Planctomycetaceae bacterium]|nr:PQQ-binding-like beta-propeller repeat protein [Planctomycetaceae bacterium]